jgi:hypothetical protein
MWADTGSAVELVDLDCFVEVAGPADPPCPVEEVASADSQHFVEEAGWVGSAVAVELLLVEQNWFLRLLQNMREGIHD